MRCITTTRVMRAQTVHIRAGYGFASFCSSSTGPCCLLKFRNKLQKCRAYRQVRFFPSLLFGGSGDRSRRRCGGGDCSNLSPKRSSTTRPPSESSCAPWTSGVQFLGATDVSSTGSGDVAEEMATVGGSGDSSRRRCGGEGPGNHRRCGGGDCNNHRGPGECNRGGSGNGNNRGGSGDGNNWRGTSSSVSVSGRAKVLSM